MVYKEDATMEQPKYRVEINKPTTGGVRGFSVRAYGDDKQVVLDDARDLAGGAEAICVSS